MALLLLALIGIVSVSLSFSTNRRPTEATVSPTPSSTLTPPPSVDVVATQPDADGYEFTQRRECYVVRQSETDPLEVQVRLRESWRASDGWAWARQTGDEPAQFIFDPDTDWRSVREVPAEAAKQRAHLKTKVGGTTSAEVDDGLFTFVSDLLGVETLPADALPNTYRRAMVDMLAGMKSVTVTRRARDPEGRSATRVTLSPHNVQLGMIQSLYLNDRNELLAQTFTIKGTGEHGTNVITQSRIVAQIPAELLTVLGSDRVTKELGQQRQDPQKRC